MVTPNREKFLELSAQNRPIPIVADMLADMETPLSTYWKLAHDAIHSFLLESVTGGEQVARYSFIGARPKSVLRSKNGQLTTKTPTSSVTTALELGQDPLHALAHAMPPPAVAMEGLPKLIGGAVGFLAYDFIRYLEEIGDSTVDDLQMDDMAMMLCDEVVAFDHAKNLLRIIVLADPTPGGYDIAIARIEATKARISSTPPPLPSLSTTAAPVTANMTQAQFEANVSRAIEYISQGDGVQMVPSQRFETSNQAHPVTLYRCLRSLNPSPYMFIYRFGDFDVVGASPELQVGLEGRVARVRPIAGTRWRGADAAEDQRLAEELLADEKERAEHVMLVDLGRNDLGRVCEYGSVKVGELMVVERYSHVMHIVSEVTGTLRPDLDAFDLIRATFPAGTVSGAPKIRAMQVIEELEPTRRGLYAGAVGYISATGDLDTAIALRTVLLKNGKAYVQAGGGVVVDSDTTYEYNESCNKARAALRAIEMAHTGELFA
ncbi:MAG: anthranilate synthase component I [Chthonomonas sp.]|nr:anthranilate synthase component I [Chthonomonas sp.]